MNLAWQLPLWKWILTDWIYYETSSFYPETVIRNRETDASAIAWKMFINSLLLNVLQNWNIFEKSIPEVVMEQYSITFNIFITNMGSGTELTLRKFGDDIKSGGIVKCQDRRASIQRDFNKAEGKADRTVIKFSNDRCQCCNWARAHCTQVQSGTDLLDKTLPKGSSCPGDNVNDQCIYAMMEANDTLDHISKSMVNTTMKSHSSPIWQLRKYIWKFSYVQKVFRSGPRHKRNIKLERAWQRTCKKQNMINNAGLNV